MIIVLGNGGVHKMFSEKYKDVVAVPSLQLPSTKSVRPDLIVFTGGTDVNPQFYGQQALEVTDYPDKRRDEAEAAWFSYGRVNRIPMTGICRGAQFGCIMSGGELYQHVDNHAMYGMHGIETEDGRFINVTSTHHQMMAPEFTHHELIGWAHPRRSSRYLWDNSHSDITIPDKEAEIVYFYDTKFLAAQYHPEFMEPESNGRKYYFELLETKFPELAKETV